MSLRKAIPNFDDSLMEICSGKRILEEYIKPLLSNSSSYYKISSFFTPTIIKSVLQQIEECFKHKGRVKLIIGVHDSGKLIPILDRIKNEDLYEKFKLAVQNILKEGIKECLALAVGSDGFLNVFSELIKQDLIQIKVACVRKDFERYLASGEWPSDDSTFHPKVSIFKDATDKVVMSGSINSTNKGFGENVEEASFTGSWTSPALVSSYEDVFEKIWENRHADSYTLTFNEEIREIVSSIIQNSEVFRDHINRARTFSFGHVSKLINESPLFFHFSLPDVRFLPHQYLVYRTILSRWPVVGLIADEVGLGKTIEAGATIRYLKRFFNIGRTALLVPSALRYQWQNEMYNLFGLKFYIYDSSSKSLVFAPNNEERDCISNVERNYFNRGIENIIFSWHYLRTSANGEFRLTNEDNVDFVLVDEAHGARLSGDQGEEPQSTLLYQFLRQYLSFVPHKLLLTATPFQTQHFDYLSLLRLLMSSDSIDEASLRRIATLNANRRLLNQQKVDAMKELVSEKPYVAKGVSASLDTDDLRVLLENYDDELYIKNHPTTVYTLRNTRNQLKAAGYKFPVVHLESLPIELSKQQRSVFQLADNYIENHLFSLESVLGIQGIGFVKTIYQQRIVSSIKACYDTLTNRLNNLNKFIAEGYLSRNIETPAGDDEFPEEPVIAEPVRLSESEISIARSEAEYVREVLNRIEQKLFSNKEISDPKIDRALEIIDVHLQQGESIIVFSRFTSTTNYLVQKITESANYSLGRYQGDLKQYIHGVDILDLSRQEISNMFVNRNFPVIICSDAASEGLNLQTANVIINIDVPWNPARLLQRFGRIDRFGQKKENIFFYNLFYPNTIEDRMYSRLHQRNNDFRELLGSTPEITSESHIRDLQFREVMDQQNNIEFSYKNSLIELTKEYNIRMHELILERLDLLDGVQSNGSTINYFGNLYTYSSNELDSNYLDLNHPLFKELRNHNIENPAILFELRNSVEVLFFYCVKKENRIFPIINIKELLDYLICGKPINRSSESEHIIENDLNGGLLKILSNDAYKLINHYFISFNNVEFNFYQGLELIETEVRIDCNFV